MPTVGRERQNASIWSMAGSTWCRDRMLEKGIENCDVLIQVNRSGAVFSRSKQSSARDDRFVIFSGGKFELRKGQDLVLKAVKILQERHSGCMADQLLVQLMARL